MGFIVTVGNEKGGCGKSTLSLNLACAAVEEGMTVLLCDSDKQQSTKCWSQIRGVKNIDVITHLEPSLHKELPRLRPKYDLILVDPAGRMDEILKSAIAASDLLVIPILPDVFDLWASKTTIEVLKQIRKFNQDVKASFVLNQVKAGAAMTKAILSSLENYKKELEIDYLGIFNTQVYDRTVFKRSKTKGQGVVEYEPSGHAASEIRMLYAEMMDLLQG